MKRKWKLKKKLLQLPVLCSYCGGAAPQGCAGRAANPAWTLHFPSVLPQSRRQREISKPFPTARLARLDSMAELPVPSPVSGLHAMILHLPAPSPYQTALPMCVCTHEHKGSAKHDAFWYELLQMFHPPPDLTSVPPSVAAADLGCFFSELTPSI